MRNVAITLAIISAVLIAYLGGQALVTQDSTSTSRNSYERIAVKACVDEATRYDALTNNQAETYCQCAMDEIYGGMTVEEMRQVDAEFVNGDIPAKYDDVILRCASLVM